MKEHFTLIKRFFFLVRKDVLLPAVLLLMGPVTIYALTAFNTGSNTSIFVNGKKAVSANADLANLSLSSGSLAPAFATGTFSYTATVSNVTTSITVTPTTSDPASTVTVNGVTVTSGNPSADILLNVGTNVISTIVTSQDGSLTQTYTVTVTRPPSSDAGLANLTPSEGSLNPAFDAGVSSYTLNVHNAATAITIIPVTHDSTSTIKVNGIPVVSGNESAAIPVSVGPNTVIVLVTAQDSITTRADTITVMRAASSNAALASLSISTGTLYPSFDPAIFCYNTSVANAVSSVTITPVVLDSTATITVNGTAVTSGAASDPVSLNVGKDTITTVVTAQNGITQLVYTIIVTRVSLPPALAYSGPQIYNVGTAITPLTPASSGVAAPAYSRHKINLGSGFDGPGALAVDTAGNIYVADANNSAIKKIPVGGGPVITLDTCFYGPLGVAVDPAGNVYVADAGNGLVKKIPAGGGRTVILSTSIYYPTGIALDKRGNIYVTDSSEGRLYKIPAGGGPPVLLSSSFTQPYGVAPDNDGNIYVADAGNGAVYKITSGGGAPVDLGISFYGPAGLAVDAANNVYVADSGNQAITKIPADGSSVVCIGGGFSLPIGLALDGAGNVYVGDVGNNTVKEIKPEGGYFLSPFLPAGLSFDSNTGIISGTPAEGLSPTNYKFTANNNGGSSTASVNITVISNNAKLAGLTISRDTIAPIFNADTLNYTASVSYATTSIKVKPTVADPTATVKVNGNAVISGKSSSGIPLVAGTNSITTQVTAGDSTTRLTYTITVNRLVPPVISYSSPNIYGIAAAITPLAPNTSGVDAPAYNSHKTSLGFGFYSPTGVAVDAAGNVYVADAGNNAVKKIPAAGGPAVVLDTAFFGPTAVAVDTAGNVYVVDAGNGAIKKIPAGGGPTVTLSTGFNNPTGIAVTAAGKVFVVDQGVHAIYKVRPDGSHAAVSAAFLQPSGLAIDAAGNLYVADSGNGEVLEIPAGSTVPVSLSSGFVGPTGVAVDAAGNVYVSDAGAQLIAELPVSGGAPFTISSGYLAPYSIAIDALGNLYVADLANNAIKQVTPVGGYFLGTPLPAGLNFDGATGVISGTPVKISAATNYMVTGYNKGGGISAAVNIQVASTNAKLSNLTISSGTLSPVFATDITSYALSVPNATSSITVTPTAADGGATIKVNGTPVASGNATSTISLDVGTNTITTSVTAQDGTTQLSYVITLNRLSPLPTISYSSSHTYIVGNTITPLVPASSDIATPGYNSNAVTVGAGFTFPTSIAKDTAGNIYIADYGNSAIKKIPAGGGAPVTVGSGFNHPIGVAVDVAGNVYVGDYQNNAVKKIPAGGGSPVTIGSGFSGPYGVAVDAAGNVYVADKSNNAIKKIPVAGGGPLILGSGFSGPTGVAVDAAGNIFVADYGNNAVKKIPAGGGVPVIIGSGFNHPYGVSVDGMGNVFVADQANNAIKEIPAGGGSTVVVSSGFNQPTGVLADASGNVYVADFFNNAIKEIKPAGGYYISPALPNGLSFDNISGTISGTPMVVSPAINYTVSVYNNNFGNSATVNIRVDPFPVPVISYNTPNVFTTGTAITPLSPTGSGVATPGFGSALVVGSGFSLPTGVVKDNAGNIYVADYGNSAIKKLPAGGGTPVTIGSGFNHPIGISLDTAGNVYVADYGNSALKKTPAGGGATITLGFGFNGPRGVAVDNAGNIYVADYTHNAVKKISTGSNTPVTIGSGFNLPTGIAVDAAGNVYVADFGNNAVKMIPAGGGGPVTIGSGFSHPYGVAVDALGNVFVADQANNAIKEIPAGGGGPVTLGAGFSQPTGVFADGSGNIYIADFFNNAIKQLKPVGGYFVNKSLPVGLIFDGVTGIITGTPVNASPATNYVVTAYNANGSTTTSVNIKVNAFGSFAESKTVSVTRPADTISTTQHDRLVVHPGVSPNGDGINDTFTIEGLNSYPDNQVVIMNRSGNVVFEAKGYDNSSKVFDGHSSKTGAMQQPGTYFYLLEYRSGDEYKRKTGYLVLKY
ncbi:hypothetical protein BH09BAC6_BH09BAC6_02480 [soil metagenome]